MSHHWRGNKVQAIESGLQNKQLASGKRSKKSLLEEGKSVCLEGQVELGQVAMELTILSTMGTPWEMSFPLLVFPNTFQRTWMSGSFYESI